MLEHPHRMFKLTNLLTEHPHHIKINVQSYYCEVDRYQTYYILKF